MNIEHINGMGYVRAAKQHNGWALLYRGTRNEVYPGTRFQSSKAARMYHAVQLQHTT
jgi:hypothetical protein